MQLQFEWIEEVLGIRTEFVSLLSMDEMFPGPGMRNDLSEFFLMDAILNRRIVPPRNDNNVAEPDPDSVVMVQAYGDGDLVDDLDFKYRTLVAFLPGAGVFYCAREQCWLEVGCKKAHIQLDASWFRFREDALVAPNNGRFSFGVGGYVKRLAQERNDNIPQRASVGVEGVQQALSQLCRGVLFIWQASALTLTGPHMAPNVIGGHKQHCGLAECRSCGQAFNERLASAPSARPGGRHFAKGCLQQQNAC